jgi:hypothetical protein
LKEKKARLTKEIDELLVSKKAGVEGLRVQTAKTRNAKKKLKQAEQFYPKRERYLLAT